MLKERTEEMKKQINNIYEVVELLTNESKKQLNLNESNDDEQKDIQQSNNTTIFFQNQRKYRKADEARKEQAKEYEQIKQLVEENVEEHVIKNAEYDKLSKNVKLIPHQKKRLSSIKNKDISIRYIQLWTIVLQKVKMCKASQN